MAVDDDRLLIAMLSEQIHVPKRSAIKSYTPKRGSKRINATCRGLSRLVAHGVRVLLLGEHAKHGHTQQSRVAPELVQHLTWGAEAGAEGGGGGGFAAAAEGVALLLVGASMGMHRVKRFADGMLPEQVGGKHAQMHSGSGQKDGISAKNAV